MKNIQTAITEVMTAVGAVAKRERNASQGFNFRGIDSVVNAVSPAMRAAGLVVHPTVQQVEYATVEVGKSRTPMGHVRIVAAFTFTAPDGSSITSVVPAEAMDSGDKATAKAMSVAFRTALLQTFVLPTDETDPDSDSYERAPQHNDSPAVADRPVTKASTTNRQPEPTSVSTGPFTRSQFLVADKQARKSGFPSLTAACASIVNRDIATLDDLNADDLAIILPSLFNPKDDTL